MEKIFLNQTLDKNTTKKLLSWFLDNYSELRLGYFLDEIKSVGFHFATKAGFSLGFDDLRIPDGKERVLKQAELEIFECENDFLHAKINSATRYQRLLAVWAAASESLKDEVTEYFEETDFLNPLYMMAFSGARGNISQVRQLIGMRGLMSDSSGGVIDFPIRSNFREGLSVTEYAISCYGARKGLIDTALRTADSGYLTRRLVDVAQKLVIGRTDCGTNEYFLMHDLRNEERCDPEALLIPAEERVLGRLLGETLYFQDERISHEHPYQPYAHPSDPSWQKDLNRTSPEGLEPLSPAAEPNMTRSPGPTSGHIPSTQDVGPLSFERPLSVAATRKFSKISLKPVPRWFSTSVFKVNKGSNWVYKNFLPRDVFIRTPLRAHPTGLTGPTRPSVELAPPEVTLQQPLKAAPAAGNLGDPALSSESSSPWQPTKSMSATRVKTEPNVTSCQVGFHSSRFLKTSRSLSFYRFSNPVLFTVIDYESRGKKEEKRLGNAGKDSTWLSESDIWPNKFGTSHSSRKGVMRLQVPVSHPQGIQRLESNSKSFESEVGPGLLILRPIEMMFLDERSAFEKTELLEPNMTIGPVGCSTESSFSTSPEPLSPGPTKRKDVNTVLGETSAKFSGGWWRDKKYSRAGKEIDIDTRFAGKMTEDVFTGPKAVGPVFEKHAEDENFQIYLLGVKNEEILPDLLEKVSEYREPDQGIPVRSALTCRPRSLDWNTGKNEDIRQYCYGWNLATGRLVFIGEAVGILAAQSIGEPGTQLTMRTFHTGGVFSAEVEAKVFAPHGGIVSFSGKLPLPQFTTALGQKAFFITEELQIKISQEFESTVSQNDQGLSKNENFNFIQTYNEKSIHESFQKTEGKKLNSILELPPYSYVFIFPGQKIERNQVCAEISKNSGVPRKAAETFTKSKPVRLEIQGQIGRPEEEIRLLENGEKKWLPIDPWEGKFDPNRSSVRSELGGSQPDPKSESDLRSSSLSTSTHETGSADPKIGFHQEYIWVFSGKPVSYPRIAQSCDYISPQIGIRTTATSPGEKNFLESKGIVSFEKIKHLRRRNVESDAPKAMKAKVQTLSVAALGMMNEKSERSSLVSIQEFENSNFLAFLTYFQSSQKPFFPGRQLSQRNWQETSLPGAALPSGRADFIGCSKLLASFDRQTSEACVSSIQTATQGMGYRQHLSKLGEIWFGEENTFSPSVSGKTRTKKRKKKESLHRFLDSNSFENNFHRLLFFLESAEPFSCGFWNDIRYWLQEKKISEQNFLFLRRSFTKILLSGVKYFPQFLDSFGQLWLEGNSNFDRSEEYGKLGIFGRSVFEEPLYNERWNYSLFDRWNKYYWTKSIQLFWPQKKYSDLDPMLISEQLPESRRNPETALYEFLLKLKPEVRNRLLLQLEAIFAERFAENDESPVAPPSLPGFRGFKPFQVFEDDKFQGAGAAENRLGLTQHDRRLDPQSGSYCVPHGEGELKSAQINTLVGAGTESVYAEGDVSHEGLRDKNSELVFSEEGFDQKPFEFHGKLGTHQKAIVDWDFRKWIIGGFNGSTKKKFPTSSGSTDSRPGGQSLSAPTTGEDLRSGWAMAKSRDFQAHPQNFWSFAKKLHQRGWSKEMVKAYVSTDPFFEVDEVPLTLESKFPESSLTSTKVQLKAYDEGTGFDRYIDQDSLLSSEEIQNATEYWFKDVFSPTELDSQKAELESKPHSDFEDEKRENPHKALELNTPGSWTAGSTGAWTSGSTGGDVGLVTPIEKPDKFGSGISALGKLSSLPRLAKPLKVASTGRKFTPGEADKEFFLAVDLGETTRPFQRELEKESQKYVKPKKLRLRQPELQSQAAEPSETVNFKAEGGQNSGIEVGQNFHGGSILEPDEYSENGQITLQEIEFFDRKKRNRPVFGETGEIHTRKQGNPADLVEANMTNFAHEEEKRQQTLKAAPDEVLISRRHNFSRIKESQLPEYNFVQFTDLRLWNIPGNLLWVKPLKWETGTWQPISSAAAARNAGAVARVTRKIKSGRATGAAEGRFTLESDSRYSSFSADSSRMMNKTLETTSFVSRDRRLNWSQLPSIQKKLQKGLFDPVIFGRSLGELTVSGNAFQGSKSTGTARQLSVAGRTGIRTMQEPISSAAPLNPTSLGSVASPSVSADQMQNAVENQISFDKSNQILRRTWLAKTYSLAYTLRLLHPYRTDFSRGNFALREKSLEVREGEILKSQEFLFSQTYEETRTGDIVQGLPKIEQLFEARRSSPFTLVTLHQELKKQFTYFCEKFPPLHAARLSLRFIQRVLVDEIQLIYHEQGVDIHDKHIELIVRQMTRRVAIRDSGTTHFLPSSVVEIDILERYAASRKKKFSTHQKYSSNIADTGLIIEPVILGLTKTSLVTTNFLSAASFQEARRMLFVAATKSSVDFLSELKHDVLVGRYLRAGSTFHGNTRLSSLQKRS